jgi:hypothetical protein
MDDEIAFNEFRLSPQCSERLQRECAARLSREATLVELETPAGYARIDTARVLDDGRLCLVCTLDVNVSIELHAERDEWWRVTNN